MGNDNQTMIRSQSTTVVAVQRSSYPVQTRTGSIKVKPPAAPIQVGLATPKAPQNYQMHKLVINDGLLERFLVVQDEISKHNAEGVFEGLQQVEEEYEKFLKERKQADVNYRVLREQSNKEKQDYDNITSPTVQAYFRSKQDHERAIEKEKHEYLESIKQVEAAERNLKEVSAKYQAALDRYNNYQSSNKIAIDLFNEQMNILYSTYEGAEGSDLENRLEAEVKELTEQKEILKSALNKWSNARFLLVYAYNQLQCSELRWKDLMNMDIKNPEKVIPATEVRNNLIAAYQNLVNTKSYLKNVTFPYCTEDDLKSLQNLSAATYQDMMSPERQKYAYQIIVELIKRCFHLNQWFDQVIKSTLVVDYSKCLNDLTTKTRDLRDERIKLLQIRIKEKTGQDVNVNLFNVVPEKNLAENDAVLEKVNSDANKIEQEIGGTEEKKEEKKSKTPVPDYELPPPPSKDQILGDIEQIKKQYREQTEGWNKHLDDSRREADERLQKMLAQHSK